MPPRTGPSAPQSQIVGRQARMDALDPRAAWPPPTAQRAARRAERQQVRPGCRQWRGAAIWGSRRRQAETSALRMPGIVMRAAWRMSGSPVRRRRRPRSRPPAWRRAQRTERRRRADERSRLSVAWPTPTARRAGRRAVIGEAGAAWRTSGSARQQPQEPRIRPPDCCRADGRSRPRSPARRPPVQRTRQRSGKPALPAEASAELARAAVGSP